MPATASFKRSLKAGPSIPLLYPQCQHSARPTVVVQCALCMQMHRLFPAPFFLCVQFLYLSFPSYVLDLGQRPDY